MKAEIVFVLENKLGGVTSFNRNIIENSTLRKTFYVKIIWVDQVDAKYVHSNKDVAADESINFTYEATENKYAVLSRLSSLFGERPGALICNDGLEMEAIYKFGTAKTVYQVIHDFYNIKLAVKYGAIVDVFVTHTGLFADVLKSSDPSRVNSYHIRHGVIIPPLDKNEKDVRPIRIVFTGRLVESKGVSNLISINKILVKKGITTKWTIIGKGPMESSVKEQWRNEVNVEFASPQSNREVIDLMAQHDIFILPTSFEGSPVTILEALSVGLVPVVSDLPGGIRETVLDEIGFRIPVGNNIAFADAIEYLQSNPTGLAEMSARCRRLAQEHHDIHITSDNYFALFGRFHEFKREKKSIPPIQIGFRLDKEFLPNTLVKFLRKGFKLLKKNESSC